MKSSFVFGQTRRSIGLCDHVKLELLLRLPGRKNIDIDFFFPCLSLQLPFHRSVTDAE